MNEIKREIVSIGLDFRPIPIDLGDGKVWEFHPDPDKTLFNNLVRALKNMGAVGKAMQDGDSDDFEAALDTLAKAQGALLVKKTQRDEWAKADYGMAALSALADVLMEQITGFTQQSQKPSGKG